VKVNAIASYICDIAYQILTHLWLRFKFKVILNTNSVLVSVGYSETNSSTVIGTTTNSC